MLLRHSLVALLLTGLAACGGGSGGGSPTTPTPVTPAPTVASLSISPATDLVTIQGAVALSATATMSDGTTKAASGTWASDAPSIATVDGTGKVTGIAPGQATVTVTYENVKATRAIRVVPDYQGSWTGDYTVLACQDSGDFHQEDWCKVAMRDLVHVTMTLTQNRDAVTGAWTHRDVKGTVSGTISTDGTLALEGNGNLDNVPLTITGWRSRSTDNKTQSGRFTISMTSSRWSGSSQALIEIRTCTKG